jgi:probable F420-dependent oxidoreductase
MGADHDALRARLGRIGVWTFAFDERHVVQIRQDARAIESFGYPALWVPEGGGSRDVLVHLSLLLHATDDLTVCSGIANITARQPDVLQAGAVTLADGFGDRPVIGVGVGHEYSTERRGVDWSGPLDRMRTYLDRMDAFDGLPKPERPVRKMVAALGDRMLGLAAERSLGAHSYFVPVVHTAHAREVLGREPVLAVEQTVVLSTDRAQARAIGGRWARGYLELPNYANNWRRMGFGEDDVTGDGSDRLIDAGIAWGDVEAVAAHVREHLDAGADHVCLQVISDRSDDACLPQLQELAGGLLQP